MDFEKEMEYQNLDDMITVSEFKENFILTTELISDFFNSFEGDSFVVGMVPSFKDIA